MRNRTKALALRVIALYGKYTYKNASARIGKQVLRSATSVAANYRAACRARSANEFYAKLCIAVEEADETVLWLGFLTDSGLFPPARVAHLQQEALEILKLLATSRKNAKP